jgi:hypothetical protein
VLKKILDQTEPEKGRTPRRKDQCKGRSLFEFPNDALSVEGKAGRIPNNARQVKLATGKGGLLIHGW